MTSNALPGAGEAQPIHVLLMDDHAIFRRGIRQLIGEEFPHAVFGEAQNLAEARQQLGNSTWSIIILDISVPDGNGLDLLKEIRFRHSKALVLMLSMYPERQYAIRALRAGAAGYLTKDSALEELIKAVRKILAGGRYLSSALAGQLSGEMRAGRNLLPHERLSTREFAVVCAVVAGKKASDIAVDMGLNAKTVSTYRRRAMEKMQTKTNADLVRYALENALI